MGAAEAEGSRRSERTPILGEVTAVAPIRVCDLGGWTDTWFSRRGMVFNIAVSPGVEVRVRILEAGSIRHRIVLEVANFGDTYGFEPGHAPGRHPLLEAVIDDVGVPDGVAVKIRVASDVPAGSSTGTSAAVAVALIGALDALARPRPPLEVAQAAHRVEVERLGLQSGVQDQLCAAFGGVSFIEVGPYPQASRTGLSLPGPALQELGQRLVLLHLGRPHRSSEIHDSVIERLLHADLVSAQAQAAIDIAAAHGASGWKVNGAGGEGGSLSLLAGPDPARRHTMERALLAADASLQVIPTCLSQAGLQVRRSTPPGAAAS
jgi:D-glycero-alpha-D-manno-heptose-7-phosphate kinase